MLFTVLLFIVLVIFLFIFLVLQIDFWGSPVLERQCKHERGTYSYLRTDRNGAARPFHNRLADGQPQPRALRAIVQFGEPVEHTSQFFWFNSHTRIRDVEEHFVVNHFIAEIDAPHFGKLDSVSNHVRDDLEHPVLVRVQHNRIVRRFEYQLDPFGHSENMRVVYFLA